MEVHAASPVEYAPGVRDMLLFSMVGKARGNSRGRPLQRKYAPQLRCMEREGKTNIIIFMPGVMKCIFISVERRIATTIRWLRFKLTGKRVEDIMHEQRSGHSTPHSTILFATNQSSCCVSHHRKYGSLRLPDPGRRWPDRCCSWPVHRHRCLHRTTGEGHELLFDCLGCAKMEFGRTKPLLLVGPPSGALRHGVRGRPDLNAYPSHNLMW